MVLTLTCPDTVGVVAAVSGFLASQRCTITEAQHHEDPHSVRSFMRSVFHGADAETVSIADMERRFAAEVRDPRDRGQRSGAALGTGRQNIRAPMPGKVIRVLVREGDELDVGQGLVVVEAMKMQNEMKALRGGRIADVRVRGGETVAAGDTLVVIG